jgi:GTP-binding protein LepA
MTGTIATRDMEEQLLDAMDLEKERGITIKAHPVTMLYKAKNGETYELNLIDTPGHVDFAYEVSRSLSACEGALLVIDAAQGVEAQTVANYHLAAKQNLTIIPVINKIDLGHANVPQALQQLEDVLAVPSEWAIPCSAKQGIGIEDILEAIIERVPPPKPTGEKSLQALAFDSYLRHLQRRGDACARVQRRIKAGHDGEAAALRQNFEVKEVGSFNPKPYTRDKLETGETGYMTANIKSAADVKMGDTITDARNPSGVAGLQGDSSDGVQRHLSDQHGGLRALKTSMGKLKLNDSAFVYSTETSVALGFGFRCGFLGLLHLEIVQERLRREYNMDIIATYPSVVYKVI